MLKHLLLLFTCLSLYSSSVLAQCVSSLAPTGVSGNTVICSGGSTTLTVSGGRLGDNATWKWYSGSCGGTAVGTGSSITVSPTSNTTYYVRAEGGTCSSTTACASAAVTVNARPAAPTSVTPSSATAVCQGATVTVKATSSGNTIYWYTQSSGGTAVGSVASNTNYVVTPAATGNYYAEAVTAAGCTSATRSATALITVNALPNNPGNPTSNSPQCGTAVTLTRNGTPPTGETWYWETTVSGTTTTSSGATFSAASTGTYYIRSRNNTTLCWSAGAGSVAIVVNSLPSAPTSVTPSTATSICQGASVTVNATSAGNTIYWYTQSTGGTAFGSSSSATNYVVSPSATGKLYAEAVTTAGCISATRTATGTITVNALPADPGNPTSNSPQCSGSVTITRNGTPPSGVTWYWETTSGSLNTTSSGTTFVASTSGTYYIRARNNTSLCWSSGAGSTTVVANATPAAPTSVLPSSSTSVCFGNTIALSAVSTNNTIYWYTQSTGGAAFGNSESGANYMATVTVNGNFYAEAVTPDGCKSATRVATAAITAISLPAAPGNPTSNSPQCASTGVTITRNGTPPLGVTWYWQNSASGTSVANSGTTYLATSSGTYYIRTLDNSNGCWSQNAGNTSVTTITPAITSLSPSGACFGPSVLINAVSAGNTINWYTQPTGGTSFATTASGNSFVAPTANNIIYYAEAVTPAGCRSTTRITTGTINPTTTYYHLWIRPRFTNPNNLVTTFFCFDEFSITPATTSPVSNYTFDETSVPLADVQHAFNIYGNGNPGFLQDWKVTNGTPSIERSGDITGVSAYGGNQYAMLAICDASVNIGEGASLVHTFQAGNRYTINMAVRNAPLPPNSPNPVDVDFILLQSPIPFTYTTYTGCSAIPDIPSDAMVVYTLKNFSLNSWQNLNFTIDLASPSITSTPGNAFCPGGQVTLTSSNATSYIWNTGATANSINVNTAGTYSVTVAEANCSAVAQPITVTQVNALPVTQLQSQTACSNGAHNFTFGNISAAGDADQIEWATNSNFTNSIIVSSPGTINITVNPSSAQTIWIRSRNSAAGCISSAVSTTATVFQLPALQTSAHDFYCQFGNNGSVNLSASGNAPYTFLWSNSATTQNIANLSAGLYTVTTTDANGCSSNASTQVSCLPGCGVDSLNVSCNECLNMGENDGILHLLGIHFYYSGFNNSTISVVGTHTNVFAVLNPTVNHGTNDCSVYLGVPTGQSFAFDTLQVIIVDSITGDTCISYIPINTSCDVTVDKNSAPACQPDMYDLSIGSAVSQGESFPGQTTYLLTVNFNNLSGHSILGGSIGCDQCIDLEEVEKGPLVFAPGISTVHIKVTASNADEDICFKYLTAGNCAICTLQACHTLPGPNCGINGLTNCEKCAPGDNNSGLKFYDAIHFDYSGSSGSTIQFNSNHSTIQGTFNATVNHGNNDVLLIGNANSGGYQFDTITVVVVDSLTGDTCRAQSIVSLACQASEQLQACQGSFIAHTEQNFAANQWQTVSFTISGLTSTYSNLWIRPKFSQGSPLTTTFFCWDAFSISPTTTNPVSDFSFDNYTVTAADKQHTFNLYGNGNAGFLQDWRVVSGTPSVQSNGDIGGITAYDGNQFALLAICDAGQNWNESVSLNHTFEPGQTYQVTLAIRNAPLPPNAPTPIDIDFVLLKQPISYIYNPFSGCSPVADIPAGNTEVVVKGIYWNGTDQQSNLSSYRIPVDFKNNTSAPVLAGIISCSDCNSYSDNSSGWFQTGITPIQIQATQNVAQQNSISMQYGTTDAILCPQCTHEITKQLPILSFVNHKDTIDNGDTTDIEFYCTIPGALITWLRDNTTNVLGAVSSSGRLVKVSLVNNTSYDEIVHFTALATGIDFASNPVDVEVHVRRHQHRILIPPPTQPPFVTPCSNGNHYSYTVTRDIADPAQFGVTIGFSLPGGGAWLSNYLSNITITPANTGLTYDPPTGTQLFAHTYVATSGIQTWTIEFDLNLPCEIIPTNSNSPSIQQDINVTDVSGIPFTPGTVNYTINGINNGTATINTPIQTPAIDATSTTGPTLNLPVGGSDVVTFTYRNNATATNTPLDGDIVLSATSACIPADAKIFDLTISYPGNSTPTIPNPFPANGSTLTIPGVHLAAGDVLTVTAHIKLQSCSNCVINFDLYWGCGTSTCRQAQQVSVPVNQTTDEPNVVVSRISPAPNPAGDPHAYAWDDACMNSSTPWQYIIINHGTAVAKSVVINLNSVAGTFTLLGNITALYNQLPYTPAGTAPIVGALPHPVAQTGGPASYCLSALTNPVSDYSITIPELYPGQSVLLSFETYRCCPDINFNQGANFNRWRLYATYTHCGAQRQSNLNIPPDHPEWAHDTYGTTPTYPFNFENVGGAYISSQIEPGDPDLSLSQVYTHNVPSLIGADGGTTGNPACGDCSICKIRNASFTAFNANEDYDAQIFSSSPAPGPNGPTGTIVDGVFQVDIIWTPGAKLCTGVTPTINGHGKTWTASSFAPVSGAINTWRAIFDMSGNTFTDDNNGNAPIAPPATAFLFKNFFKDSYLNFGLSACCPLPSGVSTAGITVQTSFNPVPKPTCAKYPAAGACMIKLSEVTFTVDLHCPGCKAPGVIADRYELLRTNFGYQDQSNAGTADFPFTVITQANYPLHFDDLVTNASIIGDNLEGHAHGFFQEGDGSATFIYHPWQQYWFNQTNQTYYPQITDWYMDQNIGNATVLGLKCVGATLSIKPTGGSWTTPISLNDASGSQITSTNPVYAVNDRLSFHVDIANQFPGMDIQPGYEFDFRSQFEDCINPSAKTTLNADNNYMYLSITPLGNGYHFGQNPTVFDQFGSNGLTGFDGFNPTNSSDNHALFYCDAFGSPTSYHDVYPIAYDHFEYWDNLNSCDKSFTVSAGYHIENNGSQVFPYEYRPMPRIPLPAYQSGPALVPGNNPVSMHITIPQGYKATFNNAFANAVNWVYPNTPTSIFSQTTTPSEIITQPVQTQWPVVDASAADVAFDCYLNLAALQYTPPFTNAWNIPNSFPYPPQTGAFVLGDENFTQGITFDISPICKEAINTSTTIPDAWESVTLPKYENACDPPGNITIDQGGGYISLPQPNIVVTGSTSTATQTYSGNTVSVTIKFKTDGFMQNGHPLTAENFLFWLNTQDPALTNHGLSIASITENGNTVTPTFITGTTKVMYKLGTLSNTERVFVITFNLDNCNVTNTNIDVPINYLWSCDGYPSQQGLNFSPNNYCANSVLIPITITFPDINTVADFSLQGTLQTCGATYRACISSTRLGGIGDLIGNLQLPSVAQVNVLGVEVTTAQGITDYQPTAVTLGHQVLPGLIWNWTFNVSGITAFSDNNPTGADGLNNGDEVCITFNINIPCRKANYVPALPNLVFQFNGDRYCGQALPTVNSNQINAVSPIANGCGPYLEVMTPNAPCYSAVATAVDYGNSGGAPITFSYDPPMPDPSAPLPGNYTLTITDASGCQDVASFQIFPPLSATISMTSVCNGANSGSATANPVGGVPPYTYNWSNNAHSQVINGIAAGNYSVTATDSKGCSTSATVTVPGYPGVQINVTPATCCSDNQDPLLTAVTTDGSAFPPGAHFYYWSTVLPTVLNTQSIAVTQPGLYNFLVIYPGNCWQMANVTITPAQIPITKIKVGSGAGFPKVSDAIASIKLVSAAASASTTQKFCVVGDLEVDVNYYTIFNNSQISFAPGATLTIPNGITFRIKQGAHLYACTDLWEGIQVQTGAVLDCQGVQANNVLIEDASAAINLHPGATYILNNIDFNNNNIGIFASGSDAIPFGTPNGLTFESNSLGLKHPYSGYNPPFNLPMPVQGGRSYCGIYLHDHIAQFKLGWPAENFFKHLKNGIVAFNSGVRVRNTSFSDINTPGFGYSFAAPAPTCVGIYANGDLSTIDILGFGKNAGTNFSVCGAGVIGDNIQSLDVVDCHMETMFIYGVDVLNLMNATHVLINNNFITVQGTGIASTNIDDNIGMIMYNTINVLGASGIMGSGVLLQGNGTQQQQLGVNYNEIHVKGTAKFGIHANTLWLKPVNGVPSSNNVMAVVENWISIENPTIAEAGIAYTGCRDIGQFGNIIEANSSSNTNNHKGPIGFWLSITEGGEYECDSINNIYTGIGVNGSCLQTRFYHPALKQNTDGVHIMPDGSLNTQLISLANNYYYYEGPGFKWWGPFSSHSGWHENPANSGSQQIFVHVTSTNVPYNPNPTYTSTPANFVTYHANMTIPTPCNWPADDIWNHLVDPNAGGNNNEELISINDFERMLMAGTESYPYLNTELKWQDEWSLYRKLRSHPELIQSGSPEETYKLTKDLTNMAKLKTVEDGINYFIKGNTPFDAAIDSLHWTADSLIAYSAYIDSLSDTSTALWEYYAREKLSISATLKNISDVLPSLYAAKDSIKNPDGDSLKAINNFIIPTNTIEDNLKRWNSLYLNTLAVRRTTFTTAEIADIEYLAFQCPLKGGEAVYRARSMYALVKDTIYNDDCDSTFIPPSGKKDANEQETKPSVVEVIYKIVPNPAKDAVAVITNTEFCEKCQLTMYDVTGRLVMEVHLAKGDKAVRLDIRNLQSGLYLIRINDGVNDIFQDRLSIIK